MKSLKEMMNLQGRVALITGGAGHIGAAMGEALAELGAAIAVLDLDAAACQTVADRLYGEYGVPTLPLPIDLNDEAAVRSVAASVQQQFGRLDILINNAALVGTSDLKGWATPFAEQLSATWRKALEVNLTAPFVLIQACTEALMASGHGSIINVGSIYGVVGPNMNLYKGTAMGNPAAYGASKGGLMQLTRWLATNLAPAIRVNAITPGGVWRNQAEAFVERYTALTPLGRMAVEDDFKGAVAYLASDLSAYVTGHNLIIDGGWTTW
ncbi:MAG: SDR family oxidoreductase [Thermoflexales bacterium]|nr:SDR family oxidoreductase [Thermoflexales bacterium]